MSELEASEVIRPPTFSTAKPSAHAQTFRSPNVEWLSRTWRVVESSLPMWKSKRNVRIQYTPLKPSSANIEENNTDKIDDVVSYQGLNTDKVWTIHGVDTAASSGTSRSEWDWRGKGWLKVASSHWEILGWGTDHESGVSWVVTMFASTMFTPAGLDVYCDSANGVPPAILKRIKAALTQTGDAEVTELSSALFSIPIDDSRKD